MLENSVKKPEDRNFLTPERSVSQTMPFTPFECFSSPADITETQAVEPEGEMPWKRA
jgi:hypothetical protein